MALSKEKQAALEAAAWQLEPTLEEWEVLVAHGRLNTSPCARGLARECVLHRDYKESRVVGNTVFLRFSSPDVRLGYSHTPEMRRPRLLEFEFDEEVPADLVQTLLLDKGRFSPITANTFGSLLGGIRNPLRSEYARSQWREHPGGNDVFSCHRDNEYYRITPAWREWIIAHFKECREGRYPWELRELKDIFWHIEFRHQDYAEVISQRKKEVFG